MEENQPEPMKSLPYGIANFMKLQKENRYYVDKTSFIPLLEKIGDYLFLIRPRRMGKSLWIAILSLYYDCFWKDRFDEIFHDTWIQQKPTVNRNSFLILDFDFSLVNSDSRYLEKSFESYGSTVFEDFQRKYGKNFDPSFLLELKTKVKTADKLNHLFRYIRTHDMNLYILVDEYDNFANTILTTQGKDKYHELTHGMAGVALNFFRYFFGVLKGGTTGSGESNVRLFITGVSPVTMDDVTSGFNIGKNISLNPQFNEMMGFTEVEVDEMISYYQGQEVFPFEKQKI